MGGAKSGHEGASRRPSTVAAPTPRLARAPTFFVLSFEGPDRYAMAGGLGVRVTHLTETLARLGHETHLLFLGDPTLPGHEHRPPGRLDWHRWCQWISAHHPGGVYDGEDAKLGDFNESAPAFVVDGFVRPALAAGRLPVILAEEWHTAEALTRIHDRLVGAGIRDRCVLFWNANNTMSFHRVDWPRLQRAAVLTAVSRYMKHCMWWWGVDPVVVPNGIPAELLEPVDDEVAADVRRTLDPAGNRLILLKAGRFDPAKRWMMAVEAAARLNERGHPVSLVVCGGIEAHRYEVLDHARRRRLHVRTMAFDDAGWPGLKKALARTDGTDVLDLTGFVTQDTMRLFFRAADAVLANSGHEPFGLFGLEAMAAGAVVFTGSTGEEYAFTPGVAVPVESDDPDEIVDRVLLHRRDPGRARSLRKAARAHAACFTWERAVDVLLERVAFAARNAALEQPAEPAVLASDPPARDLVVYTVVHQPRRIRLPAARLPAGASAEELEGLLFDDDLNERYFRKVASTCYWPMLDRLDSLLDQGMKLAVGFSLTFLNQAESWDRELVDRFRRVVRHPHCELVAVEPRHSFLMLWDVERFVEQMRAAAVRLQALFGVRPFTADTTELMMSDVIYHALAGAGYRTGFVDGRDWVLQGRSPTTIFHAGGPLRLLARHHSLSDDVGYRFSNRAWECWPLMADQYASWLAANPGDVVVLGWDFETFGEHHRVETGIFEFLDALPGAVRREGMTFRTPFEAVARHGERAVHLPLPAFPATWAGSGGLEFFLGNPVQQAIFQLMSQAYAKARLSGDPGIIDLALQLAQSDNLHLVQWYGRSGDEAEVSAYFTPREWWTLGPDRIVWEMQQVYKNFIRCLTGPGQGRQNPKSRPMAGEKTSSPPRRAARPGERHRPTRA